MTTKNKVHWKIGGAAGQGVKSSGSIFAKTCTRAGLWAFGYTEYPSLIKGGHNTYQVRVEDKYVSSLISRIDMLVALDKQSLWLHRDELSSGGVVLYDGERVAFDTSEYNRTDVTFISVPALRLSKELKVVELMENQVFLGASFALLDLEFSFLEDVISTEFSSKGREVVEKNVLAARTGYDFITRASLQSSFDHQLEPVREENTKMFVTGNDAISLGAITAGCQFYAAYPMTPATSILHTLAEHASEQGLVVKHAEDEISVVNMTIGAGHVGVRAMCGTSGGGFALMSEGVSLAGMTETPCVIVEAMRGGPATGLPTWTEQADLLFVLNAGHGEFSRFVIAPGDPEEAFYLTAEAFNIAEQYQTPIIIITDKHLAESSWTIPFFDQSRVSINRGSWASDEEIASHNGRFKRYSYDDPSGVSKRVVPGQHKNGMYLANSYEHDEYGYSSEEVDVRRRMSDKRMRKEQSFLQHMPAPITYGPTTADLTIVCWGSTKTAVLQAMKWLNEEGRRVNVVHLTYISPFPVDALRNALSNSKLTLDVEQNATAQMAQVIRAKTGVSLDHYLLLNDGRPVYPEQVADKVRSLLPVTHSEEEVSHK